MNSSSRENFTHLIQTKERFTVKAKRFNLKYYLRRGYDVLEEYAVTFIRDEEDIGVLVCPEKKTMKIFHPGTIDAFNPMFGKRHKIMFPSFCDVEFRLKKNPETEKIPHMKLLLQDVVFEDWVHEGHGLLIELTELDNTISFEK